MKADRALSMTCGACGKVNEIDLPSAQEAARSDADKLTDGEIARRYRLAFKAMVRGALPQSLTRLPIACVEKMPDALALAVGRDVLTLMLSPVEEGAREQ